MPRPALYSSSRSARSRTPAVVDATEAVASTAPPAEDSPATNAATAASTPPNSRAFKRQLFALWTIVVLLAALLVASAWHNTRSPARKITQDDIDTRFESGLHRLRRLWPEHSANQAQPGVGGEVAEQPREFLVEPQARRWAETGHRIGDPLPAAARTPADRCELQLIAPDDKRCQGARFGEQRRAVDRGGSAADHDDPPAREPGQVTQGRAVTREIRWQVLQLSRT